MKNCITITMTRNIDDIRVLSANCRGLKDKEKRYDVVNYIRDMKADITCLQDTHLTENDTSAFKNIWNGEFILHGKHHNSRGVAILFGNHIEYTILNTEKDTEGNLLIIDLQVTEIKLKLINIYGPNTDDVHFYENVSDRIRRNELDYIVWCGDFNMTLNPSLDSYNYSKINNPNSRNYVLNLLTEQNLIDLYRNCYPNTKRYTWRRKNPIKQARLDYFIVSSTFIDLITSVNIRPAYRSDHSMTEITF